MSVSAPRRVGQIITGLGALIVLVALVGGGPIALLTFAGNPLPDHVPTLTEIGTALTSRDDGQLFLRALAVVGWLGWATFALSVLVELPFRLVRRPAPRLPGLRRQQRMAAALIGSAALILVASPATAAVAATASAGPLTTALPHGTATATTAPPATAATTPAVAQFRAAASAAPPATTATTPTVAQFRAAASAAPPATTATTPTVAQFRAAAGAAPPPATTATAPAVAQFLPTETRLTGPAPEPRYEVERGDYLGQIADRYLGDFDAYDELARLNKLKDPDRIYPGQKLRLPEEAVDRGYRPHATGMVVVPAPDTERPAPAEEAPLTPAPPAGQTPPPAAPAPRPPVAVPLPAASAQPPNMAAGAPTTADDPGLQINRPLAVSAVIAAASIVGAQVGTVFGLRRRPAGTPVDGGRHRAEGD